MERFYSKVNAIVHNRNLLKDSIIVEEKAEAEQYKKAEQINSLYRTFNFLDFKHVWKLAPALWSGTSTRLSKYPENSSFTRPSGGVFEVKLALNSKNEKVVCGSLLEFHRHRISSLIKRWTREQTKERWIMKKVLWMYQEGVMDHEEGVRRTN